VPFSNEQATDLKVDNQQIAHLLWAFWTQLLPKERHAEDALRERVSGLHTKEISTGKWTYELEQSMQKALVMSSSQFHVHSCRCQRQQGDEIYTNRVLCIQQCS
jgi:hypothetical protein